MRKPLHLILIIFSILYTQYAILYTNAYALDLEKLKTYFINGDYKAAISEGEKIMASVTANSSRIDELYYLLGLSYLKDGNYLRASDIFEIILGEFRDSSFRDESRLGLGDAYFLMQDYAQAEKYYTELLKDNPQNYLNAVLYYRLSQLALKKGNTEEAKKYLDMLQMDYPLSIEAKLNKELYMAQEIYYTVQVGSFSKSVNAQNLMQKLEQKGYLAYIEEAFSGKSKIYRVRAGRFALRKDAETLENKLAGLGYPTKIFP